MICEERHARGSVEARREQDRNSTEARRTISTLNPTFVWTSSGTPLHRMYPRFRMAAKVGGREGDKVGMVVALLVDSTSNDPIADFEMLNRELCNYGTGQLARMPQVVVVNKIDALEGRGQEDWEVGLKARMSKEELEGKLREKMSHSRLMWMSAKEKDGVDDLMIRLSAFTKKVKDATI